MPALVLSVTRLLGSGRSSDVSQKSSECRAMRSSVQPGVRAGGAAFECLTVEFAHEGDVPHRIGPVFAAEVEIIHRKRFLKYGWIGTFRQCHQDGVDVAHVVASHNVGAVGQAAGMLVVGGTEQ